MSQESYFQLYQEIINDSLKKIRKTSFKKISVLNDYMTKVSGFIEKQVYGRIQPTNYLFLYIMLFGTHNPKIHTIVLQTVQKLLSNNFINPFDNLSASQGFMKNDFKEFILIPGDIKEFFRKNTVQVYIETIMNIPSSERNDQINIIIAKNISLVFRLAQSSIPPRLIINICDFLVDSILSNRSEEYDKIFKSIFLQILRHAIQSLRESTDHKLLIQENSKKNLTNTTLGTLCLRYGNFLFDEVTARVLTQSKEQNTLPCVLIPQKVVPQYQLTLFDSQNQNGIKNGKFGWCIICRKSANYYCKQLRVPVCSYNCKQKNLTQTQQFDKLNTEEIKCSQIYSNHLKNFCRIFSKYLSHSDIRRRSVFSEIFIHLSSQIRKINLRSMTPKIKTAIIDIFRECCVNVICQTQALTGCIISIKKLIPLKIFNAQVEILLHQIAKKLTHFITSANIKQQMLKFCRDIIRSDTIFEIFMQIDCHPQRRDVVKQVINAISTVYSGVPTPQGLSSVPPQDANIRRFCLQILYQLQKTIRSSNKQLSEKICVQIDTLKSDKNLIKQTIRRFNTTQKPTKLMKKLIKQKFFNEKNSSQQIANFLSKYNKRLNHVNVGILIGDYDPLAIQIRDKFIQDMKFKGHLVDQGLRILLRQFTIPGQSQVVERIIQCFSKAYFHQNQETVFHHADAVYSFSYLLMMLQTNLHNPQVQQSEKMTLAAFSNLSKNMNEQGSQFPAQFLSEIYSSIQKQQLGFHTKHKQLQMISAYQQNQIKKAQQIHNKSLDEYIHKQFKNIRKYQNYSNAQPFDKFDISLLSKQLFPQILTAISSKIHQCQQKDQIIKNIQIMEQIFKFCLQRNIEDLVAFSVKILWDEMMKTNTMKKYILMEKLLFWVRQYNLYLYDQWNSVIYLFSMFYRNKLIKKDNSGKNHIIVISQEKCYLYDSFVQSIISKSAKFNHKNFVCLINALIQSSKQQITQNQHPFCLQKIGQVFEQNTSRLGQILPLCWTMLKEHYIELGKHKIQKTALFGYDFLKQLVTKFLKRKDLLFYQRQYLKPFEQIFNSTVTLGVKEYVVGGLSYFASNYPQNINRDGWKIIFNIIGNAFEEQEDPNVKQKALSIVKKVYQSKFKMLQIQDCYVDFVQILGNMAHQKQQIYPASCIQAIKVIIEYLSINHKINLENLEAPQNHKLDLIYWQTQWLPLLNTIYGICGDFRIQIQNSAIELLFQILMNYGKLFSYEFWKMIMQGILRPAFQQITYTSQSRPMSKKQLEDWLRNSFSFLFLHINKLIALFFKNFQLFLPDILKIYQSCILNNPNRILIQISFEALNDMLNSVGQEFSQLNWNDFIDFIDTISKKGIPKQLTSQQNWKQGQASNSTDLQHSYQNKCQTIILLLQLVQNILQKYNKELTDDMVHNICQDIEQIYEFCSNFNRNLGLREFLWKNGFFSEMKSLPGLIKHQSQALKTIILNKYCLSSRQDVELDHYITHILQVFKQYKHTLITQTSQNSQQLEEKERLNTSLYVIILDTIIPQIKKIGFQKLIQLGYEQILFEHMLDVCTQKTFCSKCKVCSNCEASSEREKKFAKQMKELITQIFLFKSK